MVDPSILGIKWKTQLWHRWRALRNVPFRRKWFVGYDLEGNSYWELTDHNNPTRLRRKVSLDKPYFHFSDFKPHPMWMQWMQFTRPEPPSLEDLRADAQRQMRLRQLSREAETKWRTVPLKSASAKQQDPRIESSWSGERSSSVQPEKTENTETYTAKPASKIQIAMEKALSRSKKDRMVVRDELGQAKIYKNRESSDQTDQPLQAAFQPQSRG